LVHIRYLQSNAFSDSRLAFKTFYVVDVFNKIEEMLSLLYWSAFLYLRYIQQKYVCVYFEYYAKDTTDGAAGK